MSLAPTYRRPPGPVKITVDQYHRMIEAGILQADDRVELIEGLLIRKDRSDLGDDPMSVGKKHAFVISTLTELDAKLRRLGSYMRIQLPVTLSKFDEPEPDGAVVRGRPADYVDSHPGPDALTCVIGASNSSLADDRDRKQRIYARAGIPQYLIINLVDGVVEEYTEPDPRSGRYFRVTPYPRSTRVELRTATKPLVVPVTKLLP